ncbi:MAG TPA: hypothetical protein V6D17_09050, partial [Candidatus Obscuribacterales bacterium]
MTEQAHAGSSGRRLWTELFVLSILSLYVELLAIKWLSADIRAFSIFRSFPLIACFVGFGLGYAVRDNKLFKYTAFAILQMVLTIKLVEWVGLAFLAFPTASVFQFSVSTIGGIGQWGNLLFFMLLLVLLLAAPFGCCVCIGARIGILFDQLPPLPAYAVNLMGAFAGSILFTAFSFLGFAPWSLLIVSALIFAYQLWQSGSLKGNLPVIVGLIVAPVLAAIPGPKESMPLYEKATAQLEPEKMTRWSPYQRLDINVFQFKERLPELKSDFLGLELGTNRSFYQYFFNPDLNPRMQGLSPTLAQLLRERDSQYSFPLKLKPAADDVLIIGAGAGQDASQALKLGAKNIDAVEIDPVIIDIGKKFNPYYHNP